MKNVENSGKQAHPCSMVMFHCHLKMEVINFQVAFCTICCSDAFKQSDAYADADTAAGTWCVFILKEIILVRKQIKRHKSPRLS